jgi:hypothetical protein
MAQPPPDISVATSIADAGGAASSPLIASQDAVDSPAILAASSASTAVEELAQPSLAFPEGSSNPPAASALALTASALTASTTSSAVVLRDVTQTPAAEAAPSASPALRMDEPAASSAGPAAQAARSGDALRHTTAIPSADAATVISADATTAGALSSSAGAFMTARLAASTKDQVTTIAPQAKICRSSELT